MKIIFFILLFFNFLFADNHLKCEEYNSFKQPEQYIKCLDNYIEKNDFTAKKQMAHFYNTSQKPYRNYQKAIEWYMKIEKQDSSAQYDIGQIYNIGGYGVEKNYKKAAYWYKKAMNNGFSGAKSNLAYFYIKGYGVKKNCTKGIQFYQDLAKQNIWYAQDALGHLYQHGICVKKDTKKAKYLLDKAYKEQMRLYRKGRVEIEKKSNKIE